MAFVRECFHGRGETWKIIHKYALQDPRIIAHRNIYNNSRNTYLFLANEIQKPNRSDDYFTYLCADDTFEPFFMERMLLFLKSNNLDIATCTSRHTEVATGKILNKFFLDENTIIDSPEEYSEKFTLLYSFYRDLWGHLIPFRVLQKFTDIFYIDFLMKAQYSFLEFLFSLLASTTRIGILAEPLHNYFLHRTGQAYRPILSIGRYLHFDTMVDKMSVFLIKKCGYISKKNHEFMYFRYPRTVTDYLDVIFACDDDIQKLLFIYRIVKIKSTRRALKSHGVPKSLKSEFCEKISVWLRQSMQNENFSRKEVIGDLAGGFRYFTGESKVSNLGYKVADNVKINKKAKTVLAILLKLEMKLSKFKSD